jgi:hypothetical protein
VEATGMLVKTPKGVEEIQTRANRLPQRKRSLLIVIDGSAGIDDMVARFPGLGDIRQSLQELIDEGYAEVRFQGATVDAPAAPAPAAAVPLKDAAGFDEAVRALSRNLYDLAGPTADTFTAKLEAARNLESFQQAIRSSVAIVESFAGKKKAEVFEQRAVAIAEKYFG